MRMNRRKLRIFYRCAAPAYMALLFYWSSGPITFGPASWVPDYVLHAAAYALLYLLVFLGLHGGPNPLPARGGYWLPWLITVVYGLSDEFHQSFVPSRVASAADLLADAAGAIVAGWGLWLGVRMRRHRVPPNRLGA